MSIGDPGPDRVIFTTDRKGRCELAGVVTHTGAAKRWQFVECDPFRPNLPTETDDPELPTPPEEAKEPEGTTLYSKFLTKHSKSCY